MKTEFLVLVTVTLLLAGSPPEKFMVRAVSCETSPVTIKGGPDQYVKINLADPTLGVCVSGKQMNISDLKNNSQDVDIKEVCNFFVKMEDNSRDPPSFIAESLILNETTHHYFTNPVKVKTTKLSVEAPATLFGIRVPLAELLGETPLIVTLHNILCTITQGKEEPTSFEPRNRKLVVKNREPICKTMTIPAEIVEKNETAGAVFPLTTYDLDQGDRVTRHLEDDAFTLQGNLTYCNLTNPKECNGNFVDISEFKKEIHSISGSGSGAGATPARALTGPDFNGLFHYDPPANVSEGWNETFSFFGKSSGGCTGTITLMAVHAIKIQMVRPTEDYQLATQTGGKIVQLSATTDVPRSLIFRVRKVPDKQCAHLCAVTTAEAEMLVSGVSGGRPVPVDCPENWVRDGDNISVHVSTPSSTYLAVWPTAPSQAGHRVNCSTSFKVTAEVEPWWPRLHSSNPSSSSVVPKRGAVAVSSPVEYNISVIDANEVSCKDLPERATSIPRTTTSSATTGDEYVELEVKSLFDDASNALDKEDTILRMGSLGNGLQVFSRSVQHPNKTGITLGMLLTKNDTLIILKKKGRFSSSSSLSFSVKWTPEEGGEKVFCEFNMMTYFITSPAPTTAVTKTRTESTLDPPTVLPEDPTTTVAPVTTTVAPVTTMAPTTAEDPTTTVATAEAPTTTVAPVTTGLKIPLATQDSTSGSSTSWFVYLILLCGLLAIVLYRDKLKEHVLPVLLDLVAGGSVQSGNVSGESGGRGAVASSRGGRFRVPNDDWDEDEGQEDSETAEMIDRSADRRHHTNRQGGDLGACGPGGSGAPTTSSSNNYNKALSSQSGNESSGSVGDDRGGVRGVGGVNNTLRKSKIKPLVKGAKKIKTEDDDGWLSMQNAPVPSVVTATAAAALLVTSAPHTGASPSHTAVHVDELQPVAPPAASGEANSGWEADDDDWE